jgi:hypothetical protein
VRTGQHPLELEALHLPQDRVRVLRRLRARRVVPRLLGQLEERRGVLLGAPGAIERADGGLELRLLLQQRLGARVVVPEARVLGEAGDLADAVPLGLDVKATPAAPRGAG